jgi:hypothetical protein
MHKCAHAYKQAAQHMPSHRGGQAHSHTCMYLTCIGLRLRLPKPRTSMHKHKQGTRGKSHICAGMHARACTHTSHVILKCVHTKQDTCAAKLNLTCTRKKTGIGTRSCMLAGSCASALYQLHAHKHHIDMRAPTEGYDKQWHVYTRLQAYITSLVLTWVQRHRGMH